MADFINLSPEMHLDHLNNRVSLTYIGQYRVKFNPSSVFKRKDQQLFLQNLELRATHQKILATPPLFLQQWGRNVLRLKRYVARMYRTQYVTCLCVFLGNMHSIPYMCLRQDG